MPTKAALKPAPVTAAAKPRPKTEHAKSSADAKKTAKTETDPSGAKPKKLAARERTVDEWFHQQDRDVEKLHRSRRIKRLRNRKAIDEVELGRRVSKRITAEEKAFMDALMLGRAIARLKTPDNEDYGDDLICDAMVDLPQRFREMHARFNGGLWKGVIPGRRAAFEGHHDLIRREVEDEMNAELEVAKNRTEVDRVKKEFLDDDIENFAENLETARLVYSRHPGLVTAKHFPEPYRSALKELHGYDPDEEAGVSINDGHITDPSANELETEREAIKIIAEVMAKESARP